MEVGAFHMDLALFHYQINDLFKFNYATSYYVNLLAKRLSDRNPECSTLYPSLLWHVLFLQGTVMPILTGWLENGVTQQYRSSPKGIIIYFTMLSTNLKHSLDCIKDYETELHRRHLGIKLVN